MLLELFQAVEIPRVRDVIFNESGMVKTRV